MVSSRNLINRLRNTHPSIALADMILNERRRNKDKLIKRLEATARGLATGYRTLESSRKAATKRNNSKPLY